MPRPQEIAIVTALGQNFDTWETVEVRRNSDDVIDHALLTVSEISSPSATYATLKLKPGDRATVSLAGQIVINGMVYLRQASYDVNSHAVQIGIASLSQSVIPSTVDASPGQYKNYTLQQIAAAVFGKVGVGFKIDGAPAGADKIFPRVSEHVGESRFAFIERLCRLRNLHLLDDGQGGILAFRGPNSDASALLVEGRNILRAHLILSNNEHADNLQIVGQNFNQNSADASRDVSASTTVPPVLGRNFKIPAEDTMDHAAAQMRVNHQADWMAYQNVDGAITQQGWLRNDGSLWFNHVRELVTVNSPMLVPENSMTFMIKGIIHRQNNEAGTTTDVLVCRQDGLGAGSGEPLAGGDSAAPSAPAAQADGPDTGT